jgi:hypothetical protein
MRRIVLLAAAGLPLALLSGCHLCHKKHRYAAAYMEGDACGCATSYSAPVSANPVPLTYESVPPSSSAAMPATPKSSLPSPPGGATH